MFMDEKIVQEILQELFGSLERVEAQSAALLQFVKDKGITNEEELAPYLERAGNASGVRWLAARVRMEHLIAGAMKAAEEKAKKELSTATESGTKIDTSAPETDKKQEAKESEGQPPVAQAGQAGVNEQGRDQQNQERESEDTNSDNNNEVKKDAA
jgi:hypothetical protein